VFLESKYERIVIGNSGSPASNGVAMREDYSQERWQV
jgi:hypothetical protein